MDRPIKTNKYQRVVPRYRTSFLDLPSEVRQQIFIYFTPSYYDSERAAHSARVYNSIRPKGKTIRYSGYDMDIGLINKTLRADYNSVFWKQATLILNFSLSYNTLVQRVGLQALNNVRSVVFQGYEFVKPSTATQAEVAKVKIMHPEFVFDRATFVCRRDPSPEWSSVIALKFFPTRFEAVGYVTTYYPQQSFSMISPIKHRYGSTHREHHYTDEMRESVEDIETLYKEISDMLALLNVISRKEKRRRNALWDNITHAQRVLQAGSMSFPA